MRQPPKLSLATRLRQLFVKAPAPTIGDPAESMPPTRASSTPSVRGPAGVLAKGVSADRAVPAPQAPPAATMPLPAGTIPAATIAPAPSPTVRRAPPPATTPAAARAASPAAAPTTPSRIIAIDWSGNAADDGRGKIWLAEVVDSQLARLENGRSREEIASHLLALARRDRNFVVGLDFAFSLPAWFLRSRGLASAADLWALADREAEQWLRRCEPPFWGRPGKGKPAGIPEHFRRTDLEVPSVGGIRPKSVFQIGGAGAVGTGSLRGLPLLHRLHEVGFAVWPFDAPTSPLLVEIYPRAITGAVVKSSPHDRETYLDRYYPRLPAAMRTLAASSEDAFDAAVSALVMAQHGRAFAQLRHASDPTVALEGRIWTPS